MRLIDVDAVEKQAYDDVHYHAELEDWEFDVVTHYLDHATTVDAVPVVHGRWTPTTKYDSCWCSCCKKQYTGFFASGWNYCPNCGARMDGDGDA
jgi:PHP family Zn ribbon phosphoesterase